MLPSPCSHNSAQHSNYGGPPAGHKQNGSLRLYRDGTDYYWSECLRGDVESAPNDCHKRQRCGFGCPGLSQR